MIPLFDNIEFIEEPNPQIIQLIREITSLVGDATLVYEHAINFLLEYSGTPSTFKSYRAEIEKFLYWCWRVERLSITEIDKTNLRKYLDFLKSPGREHVGRPTNTRFTTNKQTGLRVPNEKWRPYVQTKDIYTFTKKSLQVTLSALSRFFDHLIDEDYCERNPAAILKRKNEFKVIRQNDDEDIDYLTHEQWKQLLTFIDKDKSIEGIRNRFMVILMYSAYPRISEISQRPAHLPLMTDICTLPQHNAFVFKVPISKGHKGRNITLSDQVKEEFKLYRTALGLSPLPQKNEYTPLFPRISKGKPSFTGLGIRRIREIIDALFEALSEECYELGRENDGNTFKNATPHWLRHTGISHDINIHGRSLTDVRDDAGHDSVETTSKYIHSSIRERYESVKNKQL